MEYRLLLLVALMCFTPANLDAAVIWDYSPGTTLADLVPSSSGNWSNTSGGQNFAEDVLFTSGASLSGMDIYSGTGFGAVGDTVTIRIWQDSSGAPGALWQQFTETVSIIDTEARGAANTDINRKHADFTTPVTLAANTTYWIGMSGVDQIALAGLEGSNAPDDGSMAEFAGTTFSSINSNLGDMAMRLHGSSVPEPTTLAIWGVFGGIGLIAARRRRKVA